jgi:hypothetical protein
MPLLLGMDPDSPPDRVLTAGGWMDFEEEYLPRVCSNELLHGFPEAHTAQVIAARTYVLRAMRDRPGLGRTIPLLNSTRFQTYSRSKPAAGCADAARRVRGIVIRHRGRLIFANYVAGAFRRADGSLGQDPTNTEKWVTYNVGRSGSDVVPTKLALTTHPGNRGCMSQNGAQWLAARGYNHGTILRYFYGEDIELHRFNGSEAELALAGLLAMMMLGVFRH